MPEREREGRGRSATRIAITVKKSQTITKNLLSASGVAIFEVKREIRRSIAGKRIAMQRSTPAAIKGVIKSSGQRLQIGADRADHCEHAEDNTGEGARTKIIR